MAGELDITEAGPVPASQVPKRKAERFSAPSVEQPTTHEARPGDPEPVDSAVRSLENTDEANTPEYEPTHKVRVLHVFAAFGSTELGTRDVAYRGQEIMVDDRDLEHLLAFGAAEKIEPEGE